MVQYVFMMTERIESWKKKKNDYKTNGITVHYCCVGSTYSSNNGIHSFKNNKEGN